MSSFSTMAADLRLETHVQHAICLVEHQVANMFETNAAALQKINQAARSCNQEIAAVAYLS